MTTAVQEEIPALFKIVVLGNDEIVQGKFRDVEEVFAELDQEEH